MGLDNRIRRASIRVTVGHLFPPEGADPTHLTAAWAAWIEAHLDMVKA